MNRPPVDNGAWGFVVSRFAWLLSPQVGPGALDAWMTVDGESIERLTEFTRYVATGC